MTLKQVKRKQSKWEQIIDTVKKTAEKLPGKTNSDHTFIVVFCSFVRFLAVQDSSIGDVVTE